MLELKHLPVRSFNENLAYIHKDCTTYKVGNIKNLTRIEIHGGARPVYAFLQIVDGNKIVRPDELGLNSEAFRQLNLPEGAKVSLTLTPPAASLVSVHRKIAGNILSAEEYREIVDDISAHRYSNLDIASFLVAVGSFITPAEVLALTEALAFGKNVTWESENIVVDHHCLGEIPGNKVDLLIAAIVAAYGLPIPKVVSRSFNGCSGAADTMAVLSGVDLDLRNLKKQVQEKRGAIVSADSLELAEADKMILAVEKQNGLVTLERGIASLLAQKIVLGISHLVIDIPVGPKAGVKTTQEAMRLRKLIEYVSDMLSLTVDVVITDGSEPVGSGIGAALEARDVMKVLKNKEDAPEDLKEKALFLAGRILEFDPKLRGGQGYLVAKELLKSGQALDAFEQIVKMQGKVQQPALLGHLTRDVVAETAGTVKRIDNAVISRIGIVSGAAQYPGAGVDLFKKVGDSILPGDILYRIYSCNANDFAFVASLVENGRNGYEIS